jgi:hypothetical protein
VSPLNTTVKSHEETESCVQCNSVLKVCEIQSTDQVLGQQLTKPEEMKEYEEVVGDTTTAECTEKSGSYQKV